MEITPTTRLSLGDIAIIKKIINVWSNPYDRKKLTNAQRQALKLLETITPDLPLERLCPVFKIAPSKIIEEIERAQKILLLPTLAENTRLFKENQKLQAANKDLQAKNLFLKNIEEQKKLAERRFDVLNKYVRDTASQSPSHKLKRA